MGPLVQGHHSRFYSKMKQQKMKMISIYLQIVDLVLNIDFCLEGYSFLCFPFLEIAAWRGLLWLGAIIISPTLPWLADPLQIVL